MTDITAPRNDINHKKKTASAMCEIMQINKKNYEKTNNFKWCILVIINNYYYYMYWYEKQSLEARG